MTTHPVLVNRHAFFTRRAPVGIIAHTVPVRVRRFVGVIGEGISAGANAIAASVSLVSLASNGKRSQLLGTPSLSSSPFHNIMLKVA